jgi:hypothetical protein
VVISSDFSVPFLPSLKYFLSSRDTWDRTGAGTVSPPWEMAGLFAS